MNTSCLIFRYLTFLFLLTILVFTGCSHTSEMFKADKIDRQAVDYEVIYYIHADSDYLYHDSAGNPVRDNQHIQDEAIELAEKASSGEYFIFIQNPERKILGLFPRKSSRLYHYKNGELESLIKFRHSDKREDFLTTETDLYHLYRSNTPEGVNQKYILYYGHEIPNGYGEKYHSTLPKIEVNTGSFVAGVQRFLITDDQQFDLMVLSTCNNGSPVMVSKVLPFTRVLLASPQNLHLSHIESESLGLLESNPGITPYEIAHNMANQAFTRLQSEVQTAITLTLYNFKILREYMDELQTFATSYYTLNKLNQYSDNIDCNINPGFDEQLFSKGLYSRYRPARFGRSSNYITHSGWGCKPPNDEKK